MNLVLRWLKIVLIFGPPMRYITAPDSAVKTNFLTTPAKRTCSQSWEYNFYPKIYTYECILRFQYPSFGFVINTPICVNAMVIIRMAFTQISVYNYTFQSLRMKTKLLYSFRVFFRLFFKGRFIEKKFIKNIIA